jgi:predicted PurR-regulated permease PerM
VTERIERIRRAGQIAWALVGLAALVFILGTIAWFFRVVWPPLILAGAIVFLLNPIVTTLQERRVPRAAGAGLTYLGFFAVVGLAGLIMVPLATDQLRDLDDELPEVRARAERWINDRAEDSKDWPIQLPSVSEIERDLDSSGGSSIGERLDRVRDIGTRAFHVILIFVLAPIIAFYLLVDLPRLHRAAEELIPERSRAEVLHVARRLNRAIGGFFRGQLMVAVIVGLMVSIGLAVIDLPFWLIVGMVAGLFNIIPLIGPWVGAVPGVIIALTTRDVSTAIWVVAIMAGAQQIDNHFISPLVMQRAVKLHPSVVMLALLAGGTIGGFFGLLIAVPVAAVLKILVGHLWHTYVLGQPFGEAAAAEDAADARPGVGFVEDVLVPDDDDERTQPALRR